MFRFRGDRLQTKEKLGKGKFGSVFPYQKDSQDLKWVVKRIKAEDVDALLSSLPEIVLGFACGHPCIVPIKGYFIEKESNGESFNVYMKLPRMKTTLLEDFKERKRKDNPYSEQEITRHFYSLVCGIEYLHSKKIYHGDIKPDNLLLDEKGALQIGDIGIAKHVEEEDSYQALTGQVGTYQYSAPEIIRAKSIADTKGILPKADVWSLGTVILELCAFDLKLLNSSLSPEEIKGKVSEPLKTLEGRYTESLVALINKTLRLEGSERPSIEEIKTELEKNFAQNLDQDLLKISNSHKLSMETKYQAEITALNQQISEILAQSKSEKDELKEAISRLELAQSQERESLLAQFQLEKDQFNEKLARLELTLYQQKQHSIQLELEKTQLIETIAKLGQDLFQQKQSLEKLALEKDEFRTTISQLELAFSQQKPELETISKLEQDLSHQRSQYDDRIKTLLDNNAKESLQKDRINQDLQDKLEKQTQLEKKKNEPQSFPRFLFSLVKRIVLQIIYSFVIILCFGAIVGPQNNSQK